MNLLLNSPAPKFTLFSTEKKEVSLTDYNGKNIVILFFPLSFTGVCTKELCMVRDELTIYNDLNDKKSIFIGGLQGGSDIEKSDIVNFTRSLGGVKTKAHIN